MPKASLSAMRKSVLMDFYPGLAKVRTGANSDTTNLEEFIMLGADLYICHRANLKICGGLKKAGKTVLEFDVNVNNYNMKSVVENWIGQLEPHFAVADKNKRLIEDISATEKLIADRTKGLAKKKVLIVQRFNKNMVSSGWFPDYLLKNAGAENAVDTNQNINLEQVYASDPDLIFIGNFTTLQPEDLLSNKDWAGLKAVKNKQVFKIPLATYRPLAPNLDLSPLLIFLAARTYPEAFADLRPEDAYKKHFKNFYGLDLSEAQLEVIMHPSREAGMDLN